MRIRATVHIAGEGFALSPGDETDIFPEAEALRLVAKNAAVLVGSVKQVEIAVAVDPPSLETREEKTQTGRKPRRGRG